MDLWKEKVTLGNQAFQQKRYAEAEEAYADATRYARSVFDAWPNVNEAVSALVVSQLNMADLRCDQEDCERAEREIKDLYNFLTAKLETNAKLSREVPIWMGLQRAYSALLNHFKQHGSNFEIPMPAQQTWMSGAIAMKTNALH